MIFNYFINVYEIKSIEQWNGSTNILEVCAVTQRKTLKVLPETNWELTI